MMLLNCNYLSRTWSGPIPVADYLSSSCSCTPYWTYRRIRYVPQRKPRSAHLGRLSRQYRLSLLSLHLPQVLCRPDLQAIPPPPLVWFVPGFLTRFLTIFIMGSICGGSMFPRRCTYCCLFGLLLPLSTPHCS